MKQRILVSSIAWLALVALSPAQVTDLNNLIQRAQERSSLVRSARANVEAKNASLSGARSTASPYLELAPGVGFTNSNSVLSQEIDIFGRRQAATQFSLVEVRLAEIAVERARAEVSYEVIVSVARILAASEELISAQAANRAAQELADAVQKQNEIGEAPAVHVTRAELDVLRTSQLVTQATGRLRSANAAIQSLAGEEVDASAFAWPSPNSSLDQASARSFELLEAMEQVALAEAQIQVVRSLNSPMLTAGLASDIWSVDRDMFRGDNFGFQVSLRLPVFDAGRQRSSVRASEFATDSAKARVAEEQRVADLRLAEAEVNLETARMAAETYGGDILPRGESMLTAMREGYEAGLVTLVEVLEAQQTLIRLRQERSQAVLALRLAEVELWRSKLSLPGAEVTR